MLTSDSRLATREWAILVPAWSMVLIWITYFAYGALMLLGTPPLTSLALVTGVFASLPSSLS